MKSTYNDGQLILLAACSCGASACARDGARRRKGVSKTRHTASPTAVHPPGRSPDSGASTSETASELRDRLTTEDAIRPSGKETSTRSTERNRFLLLSLVTLTAFHPSLAYKAQPSTRHTPHRVRHREKRRQPQSSRGKDLLRPAQQRDQDRQREREREREKSGATQRD